MICQNCGKGLPEDAKFCLDCGAETNNSNEEINSEILTVAEVKSDINNENIVGKIKRIINDNKIILINSIIIIAIILGGTLFINTLYQENDILKGDIIELRSDVNELNTTLERFDKNNMDNTIFRITEQGKTKIVINPSDTSGYQYIEHSTGFFLVSLENVKPYLDGCKVTLRIGNPLNVTYNGIEIKTKFGEKMSDIKEYDRWQNSLIEKNIRLTNTLKSGSWNHVTFTLSPVDINNFGYLELEISTDNLSLYTN